MIDTSTIDSFPRICSSLPRLPRMFLVSFLLFLLFSYTHPCNLFIFFHVVDCSSVSTTRLDLFSSLYSEATPMCSGPIRSSILCCVLCIFFEFLAFILACTPWLTSLYDVNCQRSRGWPRQFYAFSSLVSSLSLSLCISQGLCPTLNASGAEGGPDNFCWTCSFERFLVFSFSTRPPRSCIIACCPSLTDENASGAKGGPDNVLFSSHSLGLPARLCPT